MSAWLAFLKSRLLLPADQTDDGPTGEELSAILAFRLERLQAMRNAGAKLMARNQLGKEFFSRGIYEAVRQVLLFSDHEPGGTEQNILRR